MEKKISDTLSATLSETRIFSIKPSTEQIDEVLTLSADHISNLTDQQLSRYIYILSQYSVFLNLQCNSKKILADESRHIYDTEVGKVISKLEGKTVKDRISMALENDEKLRNLEMDMRIRAADSTLLENIPDAIMNLSNALKKESSFRFNYKNNK